MRTSIATILAMLGVFSCSMVGFDSTAFAASVSVGRVSPMTSGVAPFSEPRYNLGPGNTAKDASADSCLRICMAETPGAPRRTRQSCRKSCALSEF